MQRESSSIQPVAGIDVSKAQLDCFIDVIDKSFTVSNDEPAIAGLIVQLRSANVRLVLIEATGRYHRRLAAQPYKAMIYPHRDRATGKPIPHSYIIGWEYSTNDDFQDVVCQIDHVELLAPDAGSQPGR